MRIELLSETVRGDTAQLVGAAAACVALTAVTIWIIKHGQPKGRT